MENVGHDGVGGGVRMMELRGGMTEWGTANADLLGKSIRLQVGMRFSDRE